mgnify:CR=1 FL=1
MNSYPIDTAATVILNDCLFHLKEEIEETLRKTLKTVNAGLRSSEVGRVVPRLLSYAV